MSKPATEKREKPRSASKRPTSQDVADLAGVSRTTVSYVINQKTGGNIRISDETRQRVWEAVETLNYHPISAARTLRLQRSNMLAAMVPRVDNPFYPHFAAALQREAEKEGLDLIICSSNNEPRREHNFLNTLLQRGVDGFVTQTYHLTQEDLDQVVSAGVAVVIHGEAPRHPYVDHVVLDEVQAVEDAVSYLIDQGHERIGTIAGLQHKWTGRVRKEGYENALRKHGIPTDDSLIIETDYERGGGGRSMKRLLNLPDPPTAVFAANDLLAIDALLYAVEAGLSVPDDIAIVGFDDIPEATMVRPKLTTVRKDVNLLAVAAVTMLVERIESEEILPSRRKVVGHEIVYRESA